MKHRLCHLIQSRRIVCRGSKSGENDWANPSKISAIKPIKNGIIDDFEATKEMLKFFINRSFKGQPLVKPNVLISSPMGITQIEKRAILEVCKQAELKMLR